MSRAYSNREYTDMIYLYGFCDENANAARFLNLSKYPKI